MIRKVDCFIAECDACGNPVDDFGDINGIPHFGTEFEVYAYLGGVHNGQILEGTGASGGVLLPDGQFYCYACRFLAHLHVNGFLIADLCARCDKLRDQHPTAVDPAAGPPARTVQEHRSWGVTARASWCATACTERHQFPDLGLPEPASRSRIEFGFQTDRYAAWRDDEQTVLAGYPAAMCWVVYPEAVGHTWLCLQRTFGPALGQAILLQPSGVLLPAPE